MVTRLAWIAAKLVSSNNDTRYASAASCSAITAEDWNRRSVWQITSQQRVTLRKGVMTLPWSLVRFHEQVVGKVACEWAAQSTSGTDEFHEAPLFLAWIDVAS
jgi:hypothetical protein